MLKAEAGREEQALASVIRGHLQWPFLGLRGASREHYLVPTSIHRNALMFHYKQPSGYGMMWMWLSQMSRFWKAAPQSLPPLFSLTALSKSTCVPVVR